MEVYKTHQNVLKFIIERFDIKSVLEYGVGEYSTAMLLQMVDELVSVESDKNWANRVQHEHTIHICPKGCHDYVPDRHFDLVFIDGNPNETRADCMLNATPYARFIVMHDTDTSDQQYKYPNICLPEGWRRLDYKKEIPWTSIYSQDKEALSIIERDLINV